MHLSFQVSGRRERVFVVAERETNRRLWVARVVASLVEGVLVGRVQDDGRERRANLHAVDFEGLVFLESQLREAALLLGGCVRRVFG